MAPQKRLRPALLDDPPTASSSSDDDQPLSEDEVVDEEEDSSEEEGEENDQNEEDEDEGSSSEEEEQVQPPSTPISNPKPDSGSELESGVESGSEPTKKEVVAKKGSLALSELCKFSEALGLSLNKDAIRRGMDLIEESKADEFDKEWRKIQIAEMELFVTRGELLKDQIRTP